MRIHTVRVGPIETNCYLVEDDKTKAALIIDPGDEAGKITEIIKQEKLKPLYIINTHGHFDHVTANLKFGLPVLSHELDAFLIAMTLPSPPDKFLKDGDQLKIGTLTFQVIHTPGHTPGGICLYEEKEQVLFSGDTLFYGTTGRTDFPYASEKEMAVSFKKLMALPEGTRVYPGHGRPTTIGNEKYDTY